MSFIMYQIEAKTRFHPFFSFYFVHEILLTKFPWDNKRYSYSWPFLFVYFFILYMWVIKMQSKQICHLALAMQDTMASRLPFVHKEIVNIRQYLVEFQRIFYKLCLTVIRRSCFLKYFKIILQNSNKQFYFDSLNTDWYRKW